MAISNSAELRPPRAARGTRGLRGLTGLLCLVCLAAGGACMSPLTNLARYAAAGGEPYLFPASEAGTATLQGHVLHDGAPLPNAVVLVAEPQGTPHTTRTDASGAYRLTGVPAGAYVPIAAAPGFEDAVLRNAAGLPRAVTLARGQVAQLPPIQARKLVRPPLAARAAQAHALTRREAYAAAAPFPEGASARVQPWSFQRDGTVNDTLYVYLPTAPAAAAYPLLFAVYPGHSLQWEAVSVAMASRGYAVVALSPLAAYGRDVAEHGADARLALHFARRGDLDARIDGAHPLAISGSYGSAVLNRLIRLAPDPFAGAVLLGGISNAFTGAAAFYAGELDWPPQLGYVLAALGTANVQPASFMQFSPVYTPQAMPPTLLLHTRNDAVIPIAQSYEYAAALKAAGVPVRTYYFADDSHYLQVGADTPLASRRVFWQVLAFLDERRAEARAARAERSAASPSGAGCGEREPGCGSASRFQVQ